MTHQEKHGAGVSRCLQLVSLGDISVYDEFRFRSHPVCGVHLADLAVGLKNSRQPFDPILLWRSELEELVLLDGEHRISAYKASGWQDGVPAIIVSGATRREALGMALKANSKRTLGLTQNERMDAAWRLVREPVAPRFKVKEISALADVAARTVDNMRHRYKVMLESGVEITGRWMSDLRAGSDSDYNGVDLTEAQRRKHIAELAKEIRDLLDRRKSPNPILRDSEAVAEAVHEALGERRFKQMVNYVLGDDEDVNEWLEMGAYRDDMPEGDEEDDEEEAPNF